LSTLKHLQADIASHMRSGAAFGTVEDDVINPSALSDSEKAALWLYGWSFVDWRRQRREAVSHIDLLVASAEAAEHTRGRLPVAGAGSAAILHRDEHELLLDAADALLFDESDGSAKLASGQELLAALVKSDRWLPDSAAEVCVALGGCGTAESGRGRAAKTVEGVGGFAAKIGGST